MVVTLLQQRRCSMNDLANQALHLARMHLPLGVLCGILGRTQTQLYDHDTQRVVTPVVVLVTLVQF